MSATDNGGPAFPVSTINASTGHQDSNITWQFPGMSLRDYFAAKVFPILADKYLDGHEDGWEGIAVEAYYVADAMLKARAQ